MFEVVAMFLVAVIVVVPIMWALLFEMLDNFRTSKKKQEKARNKKEPFDSAKTEKTDSDSSPTPAFENYKYKDRYVETRPKYTYTANTYSRDNIDYKGTNSSSI